MKEIIRLMHDYRVLKLRHIYKYFSEKPAEQIKQIIKYLMRNGQVYVSKENSDIALSKEVYENEKDLKTIAAFDVLLLFNKTVTYHTKYEYPTQICFLVNEKQYEIIYVAEGDEATIEAILHDKRDKDSNYLIIVENDEQMRSLDIENVYRFCMIDENGEVDCYVREE